MNSDTVSHSFSKFILLFQFCLGYLHYSHFHILVRITFWIPVENLKRFSWGCIEFSDHFENLHLNSTVPSYLCLYISLHLLSFSLITAIFYSIKTYGVECVLLRLSPIISHFNRRSNYSFQFPIVCCKDIKIQLTFGYRSFYLWSY